MRINEIFSVAAFEDLNSSLRDGMLSKHIPQDEEQAWMLVYTTGSWEGTKGMEPTRWRIFFINILNKPAFYGFYDLTTAVQAANQSELRFRDNFSVGFGIYNAVTKEMIPYCAL